MQISIHLNLLCQSLTLFLAKDGQAGAEPAKPPLILPFFRVLIKGAEIAAAKLAGTGHRHRHSVIRKGVNIACLFVPFYLHHLSILCFPVQEGDGAHAV